MNQEEEYIDYSCSTPLERLSRDVETLLRSWHIANGSDRHVSFHHKISPLSGNVSKGSTRGRRMRGRRRQSHNSKVDNQNNEKNDSTKQIDSDHQSSYCSSTSCVQLIRSSQVTFTTSLPDTSDRITIHFVLSLWDGPHNENPSTTTSTSSNMTTSTLSFDNNNHIPLSLLGENRHSRFPQDMLESLSSLFAIGQHLTLTPTPESLDILLKGTLAALIPCWMPPGSNKSKEGTAHSSFEHTKYVEDNVTIHSTAIHSLSNMLQTALNTATSSCDCRIPAFGIWGLYHPKRHIPLDNNAIGQKNTKTNSNAANTDSNTNNHTSSTQTQPTSIVRPLMHSIMDVPTWMNGGNLFDLAAEFSPCTSFARHSERMLNNAIRNLETTSSSSCTTCSSDEDDAEDEQQDLDTSNTSTNSPTLSPTSTHSPAFAHFSLEPTQLISRASLSSNQKGTDRLFLPPLLMGYCHPGPSILGTRAFFSLHVVPPGIQYPVHCTTLNSLGKLLLQHCSSSQESILHSFPLHNNHTDTDIDTDHPVLQTDTTSNPSPQKVIVAKARHKYHWSKIFDTYYQSMQTQSHMHHTRHNHYDDTDAIVNGHRFTSPIYNLIALLQDDSYVMTCGSLWRSYCHKAFQSTPCHPNTQTFTNTLVPNMIQYHKDCIIHAHRLLHLANSISKGDIAHGMHVEPLWGPNDDPIQAVSISVTWNSLSHTHHQSHNTEMGSSSSLQSQPQPLPIPLLTLPLRIRSHHSLSSRDILDMENTLLATVFDPISVDSSSFDVSVSYDPHAACTSLSASIRCILASLIRASTLETDTLLAHLTKPSILREFHKRHELDDILAQLITEGNIGIVTRRLVEVMDWSSMAMSMDDSLSGNSGNNRSTWRQIVIDVMDGISMRRFPNQPEDHSTKENHLFDHDEDKTKRDKNSNDGQPTYNPLKASPPGRLLSILFTCMSNLHTPAAMSGLWLEFVDELRTRWERQETLQNLGTVHGLEQIHILTGNSSSTQDSISSLRQKNKQIHSLGVGAKNTAFLNSSEPEPNLDDCLINQKLQVFNIGVESMVAAQMNQTNDTLHDTSVVSTSLQENDESIEVVSYNGDNIKKQLSRKSTPQFNAEDHENKDAMQESINENSPCGSLDSKDCFFDAQMSFDQKDDNAEKQISTQSHTKYISQEGPKNNDISWKQHRRGARCPVLGSSIVESGDQLYAPYLQRNSPITDDTLLQQKLLLENNGKDSSCDSASSLHNRITIAHRIQKPKLLSDMCSFQAANPKAGFQDFISWYGNPLNLLDEHQLLLDDEESKPSKTSNDARPCKNPMEAFQILDATRSFWSNTWNEAKPCAASDQSPLFDAFSTVEMLLLSFESLHPANLINQILAVNIANANFLLASSGRSLNMPIVDVALDELHEKSSDALFKLGRDMLEGSLPSVNNFLQNDDAVCSIVNVSPDTLAACEIVCNDIGDVEVLLSRTMSLLTKFSGEKEFVQTFLRSQENKVIELNNHGGRAGILTTIQKQQQRNNTKKEDSVTESPYPSVREYILQNRDDNLPCQLSVRMGGTHGLEEGGNNSTQGGLVLALCKSCKSASI